jgi:hypothetical protein
MQLDELEGQICRKENKNAMAKSLKSRYCKLDAVNCKGFARRRFVWYWCVHFFPTTQGHYLCPEDNSTPSRLQHCLLASKKTNTTKNRKRLMQESNSPKTDSDSLSIIDWPASVILYPWCIFSISAFSLLISRFPSWPSADWLTLQPIDRVELLWPSTNPANRSSFSLIGRFALPFHQLLLLIPFDLFFSKKWCQHMPSSFRVNNLLLRNLLESGILLDLKSTEESKQISRGP